MTTATTARKPTVKDHMPAPRPLVNPPMPLISPEEAAAFVLIPPEHDTDLGEMFDRWNEEDRQGDPEEQQRSFDLLMRLLEEDRR